MPAVLDADFFIHVSIAGKVNFIAEWYGELYTTEKIYEEVVKKGKGKPGSFEMERLRKEGELNVILQRDDFLLRAFALSKGIDESEASGILVAKNFGLIFLTHDKIARKAAEEEGVEVRGIEIKLLERHRYKLRRRLKV